MKIDIKIMAVASRTQYAESLRAELPSANIIYDDRGLNGGGDAWYNAKRIWNADMSDFTHRLVLQDDALLCNDFLTYVEKCVAFKPNAVWSFHVGWKAEKTFRDADTPYIKINGCKTSGQAVLMPIALCSQMITETDFYFGQDYKHDDSRIGWFCAYNQIDLFGTNPQLVDHRQIKSTLKYHNAKRYSRTFVADVSGLNWDSKQYAETPIVYSHLWTKNDRAVKYCNEAKRRIKNADSC